MARRELYGHVDGFGQVIFLEDPPYESGIPGKPTWSRVKYRYDMDLGTLIPVVVFWEVADDGTPQNGSGLEAYQLKRRGHTLLMEVRFKVSSLYLLLRM